LDIIDAIRDANPGRSHENIDRRCLKLCEEVGETSQAVLAVTSENNHKNMTWADVREELTDTIILGFDMLLTPMPDQDEMSDDERLEAIKAEFERKLAKWARQRAEASAKKLAVDDAA
jgi:hypothetical protein